MKKTIAILSKQAPLAEAIEMLLKPRNPTSEFIVITKLGDLPEESADNEVIIASLGIPNYVPKGGAREVISVNTTYTENVADRNAQWELLRNPNADPMDIIQILGNQEKYTIIPKNSVIGTKTDYAEARLEFAEANLIDNEGDEPLTPEEVLTRQLAAMTSMRDLALSASALK